MKKIFLYLTAFLCLFTVGIYNVNAKVTVNGVELTEDSDINGITYDSSNKTLTLKDLTINSDYEGTTEINGIIAITGDEVSKIILEGNNVITGTKNITGIFSKNDLTITGSGSLTVTANSYPIATSNGSITIDGATLNLTAKSESTPGIYSGNDVIIINNADVTSQGTNYGILATNTISIDNSYVKFPNVQIALFSYAYDFKISNLTNKKLLVWTVKDGVASTKTEMNLDDENLEYYLYIGNLEIVKYETKVDVPTIDTTKKVEEVTIGVKKDTELDNTLKKAQEKAGLGVDSADTTVTIDVKNVKTEDVPEITAENITNLVKTKKLTLGSYFDIDINVINESTNNKVGNITELDNKITFNVALPEELTNVAKGYTRTYYIVRYHNRTAEILDAKLDGNVLTFASDKFSTYAIAYTDTLTKTTNPNTSDAIAVYAGLLVISSLAIGAFVLRKRYN